MGVVAGAGSPTVPLDEHVPIMRELVLVCPKLWKVLILSHRLACVASFRY